MKQLISGDTAGPKLFVPTGQFSYQIIGIYATFIDPDETTHFEESQRDLIYCTCR